MPNTTGKLIKKLREKHGLSQKALAEKLNVGDKAVSKWENDKGYPEIPTFREIARLFNITMEELFVGDIQETTNSDLLLKNAVMDGFTGVQLLIDSGVDVLNKDANNKNIFDYIYLTENDELIEYLIEKSIIKVKHGIFYEGPSKIINNAFTDHVGSILTNYIIQEFELEENPIEFMIVDFKDPINYVLGDTNELSNLRDYQLKLAIYLLNKHRFVVTEPKIHEYRSFDPKKSNIPNYWFQLIEYAKKNNVELNIQLRIDNLDMNKNPNLFKYLLNDSVKTNIDNPLLYSILEYYGIDNLSTEIIALIEEKNPVALEYFHALKYSKVFLHGINVMEAKQLAIALKLDAILHKEKMLIPSPFHNRKLMEMYGVYLQPQPVKYGQKSDKNANKLRYVDNRKLHPYLSTFPYTDVYIGILYDNNVVEFIHNRNFEVLELMLPLFDQFSIDMMLTKSVDQTDLEMIQFFIGHGAAFLLYFPPERDDESYIPDKGHYDRDLVRTQIIKEQLLNYKKMK